MAAGWSVGVILDQATRDAIATALLTIKLSPSRAILAGH